MSHLFNRFSVSLSIAVLGIVFAESAFAQVDFTAIQRGRQQAIRDNQQMEAYQWEKRQRDMQIISMLNNQEADRYLANVYDNRQRALNAGLTPAEYWRQQRDQVLADPGFRGMSFETRQLVLQKLTQISQMVDGVR